MKKKSMILFITVTIIALVFTLLVKTVDLGYVASTGSVVGFSSVNIPFAERFAFNEIFYKVSEILGYLAFAVIALFALIGLFQLIKGKSFKKVDSDLYALALTYVFTIALYTFFDKVLVINLRPLIVPGDLALEPSFPSSHTLLSVVVFGTAISECGKINKSWVKGIFTFVLSILMVGTVLFRLFSGVHWVTDIVGGILWGEALMALFQLFSSLFQREK